MITFDTEHARSYLQQVRNHRGVRAVLQSHMQKCQILVPRRRDINARIHEEGHLRHINAISTHCEIDHSVVLLISVLACHLLAAHKTSKYFVRYGENCKMQWEIAIVVGHFQETWIRNGGQTLDQVDDVCSAPQGLEQRCASFVVSHCKNNVVGAQQLHAFIGMPLVGSY